MQKYVHIALLALLIGVGPVALPSRPQADSADFPAFVDVGPDVGLTLKNTSGGPAKDYIIEAVGSGAGLLDYDLDGDLDALLLNGSTLEGYRTGGDPIVALYRNDAGRFVDVTGEAGLAHYGWGMGVCVADIDNDGNRDVHLTAYGPNVLYRNNGDGTFEDITDTAGVGNPGWSTNCAFGDYDRDGDVDLYVANYLSFDQDTIPAPGQGEDCRFMGFEVSCGPESLAGEADTLYRNDGDGTFTDVTASAGIQDPGHYGFGAVFSDLDDDGWPDIYVANDSRANLLFHNEGDGTFAEVGIVSGTAFNDNGVEQAGMGLGVGDYDGNGLFDLFVTNFSHDTNTLYQNLGGLLFVETTLVSGMGQVSRPYLGWGTGFADLDNDGWTDVFVANGHLYPGIDDWDVNTTYFQRKEVYRNLGGGRFQEIARNMAGDLSIPRSSRGMAFGDVDNDGDVDILTVNIDDRPSLYRNEGGNQKHWISFRLEGVRSNRDALGARVEIHAGGRRQVAEVRSGGSFLSEHDIRLHFGLDDETRVDRVQIRWPSGLREEHVDIQADQFLVIKEGEGTR